MTFHHTNVDNPDNFLIFALNKQCGVVLFSSKYLLFCKSKKNNVYPCKPQFNNIKVGFCQQNEKPNFNTELVRLSRNWCLSNCSAMYK